MAEGKRRVIIERVSPEIDCGRFPIKRTVGEEVIVEADIFTDSHDLISGVLLFRRQSDPDWMEAPLEMMVNDRWQGRFLVSEMGRYLYTLQAWVDRFESWRRDTRKKLEAGQDVTVDLQAGLALVKEAAGQRSGKAASPLKSLLREAGSAANSQAQSALLLSDRLAALMSRHSPCSNSTAYKRELAVIVERERARFSSWYELFPLSTSSDPDRQGTLKDCEKWLPYIAELGFDVLYLPPIHPIGRVNRKGKNNAMEAQPEDPGSPWAIGAREGGHKSIHPELGTLKDFKSLIKKARDYGLEVALDLAYQCAPDHPYVQAHPEWFRRRPDGSIQYAENPPKKYQDIYPFDFESDAWQELWEELKSVVDFWIQQGVHIFRVDNPHTKPFPFWEWLIGEIKKENPEIIFLSEAFTRPKVMYRLAKLGFSQSYTYFAWRNTKWELTQYFTELTQTEVRDYFRPNLWPNTPDILTQYLQTGGRPAFMIRLILAATLGASYGIYGPAFELLENQARDWGSEEYLNSEKYQVRHWDLYGPDSLKELISTVNRIRRENRALQSDRSLRFHAVDNEQLICYSKQSDDESNLIVMVVNLDPYHTQSGWIEIPLESFGLDPDLSFQAHDLLTGARYLWQGKRNYVELDPRIVPAHILRVRRRVRTEHDFEYFM